MLLCVLCGMFANFRFLKRTAHIITLKSSFSYEVLIVADVSSVRVCVCVCVCVFQPWQTKIMAVLCLPYPPTLPSF